MEISRLLSLSLLAHTSGRATAGLNYYAIAIFGGTGQPVYCPNITITDCDTDVTKRCTMNDNYSRGRCIEDWNGNKCCVECDEQYGMFCDHPRNSYCSEGHCTPCDHEKQKGCEHFFNMQICQRHSGCVGCNEETETSCADVFGEGFFCSFGRCVECETGHEAEQCPSAGPSKCTGHGKCSQCVEDADCAGERVCNQFAGKCVECFNHPPTGVINKGCYDQPVNNACINGSCSSCGTSAMCNRHTHAKCVRGRCEAVDASECVLSSWLPSAFTILASLLSRLSILHGY